MAVMGYKLLTMEGSKGCKPDPKGCKPDPKGPKVCIRAIGGSHDGKSISKAHSVIMSPNASISTSKVRPKSVRVMGTVVRRSAKWGIDDPYEAS